MNLPGFLDIAIGLSLVYFLFSLACSKINEGVASALRLRSKGLAQGIRKLLEGTEPGQAPPAAVAGSRLRVDLFVAHDLVRSQWPPKRPPSYLAPSTFALGVVDLLTPPLGQLFQEMAPLASASEPVTRILTSGLPPEDIARALGTVQQVPSGQLGNLIAEAVGHIATGDPLAQARAAINNLPDGHPAKRPLQRFAHTAGVDRDKFIAMIEEWFNGAMDRLSGWYKRRTQLLLLGYAAVLTLGFNVDTIHLATTLYRNGPLSAAVANVAEKTSSDVGTAQDAIRSATGLEVPLGWVGRTDPPPPDGSPEAARQFPPQPRDIPLKALGFLITMGALSLGATFWFDLLGKIANLRNSGPKPAPKATGPP
ncbi:MAG TPA: hypothetical protein VET24_02860 [Actinomycetota bacterium]|nr:hypothetical protein [Actinomycetota bacterium]